MIEANESVDQVQREMQVRNLTRIASCENVLHLFNNRSNQVMESLRFSPTPPFLMLCLSSVLSLHALPLLFISLAYCSRIQLHIFVGINAWQGGAPNNHKQTDKLARYLQCKSNETNRQQLAKFEWFLFFFLMLMPLLLLLLLLKNKNGKLCALNWLIKNCRSSLLLVQFFFGHCSADVAAADAVDYLTPTRSTNFSGST